MALKRDFARFQTFAPDRPPLHGNAMSIAQNVYPRAKLEDGSVVYGPWSAPTVYSGALGARCQGAFSGRSNAGNVTTFAGDATKLYTLATALTWTDVSSGAYTIASTEHWEFVQFGNVVMATDFADNVQAWTLDSSAVFAALAGSPPKARHIGVWEPGFVVLGNLVDSGTNPGRIRWSGFNDQTNWPTIGSASAASAQSDQNDMAIGGWVQRIIGPVGGSSGTVFLDTAIYRADYIGPPSVFRLTPVVQGRGTPSPFSVVPVAISDSETVAFFYSGDGFYRYNGATAQPIGINRVDLYAVAAFNAQYNARVYGWSDPTKKLVFWSLPNATGNSSQILVYNWALDEFSELDPSAMSSKPGEFFGTFSSIGYTLDGLDAVSSSVDTLAFSLDDRAWTGGVPTLGYFDSDHKLNYFSGSNLAARLETANFGDSSTGRRIFCSGVRPIISASPAANVTGSIGYVETPNGTLSYTSATAAGSDGVCPQRITGRYLAGRVDIAAATTWTQIDGMDAVIREEGLR